MLICVLSVFIFVLFTLHCPICYVWKEGCVTLIVAGNGRYPDGKTVNRSFQNI